MHGSTALIFSIIFFLVGLAVDIGGYQDRSVSIGLFVICGILFLCWIYLNRDLLRKRLKVISVVLMIVGASAFLIGLVLYLARDKQEQIAIAPVSDTEKPTPAKSVLQGPANGPNNLANAASQIQVLSSRIQSVSEEQSDAIEMLNFLNGSRKTFVSPILQHAGLDHKGKAVPQVRWDESLASLARDWEHQFAIRRQEFSRRQEFPEPNESLANRRKSFLEKYYGLGRTISTLNPHSPFGTAFEEDGSFKPEIIRTLLNWSEFQSEAADYESFLRQTAIQYSRQKIELENQLMRP